VDSLLVKAGSGALTFWGIPTAPGCRRRSPSTPSFCHSMMSKRSRTAFTANKNQIAGIIVEPVPGNCLACIGRAGLSGIPARISRKQTRVADFRRSDDRRFSSRAGGAAGTITASTPGLDVSRQNHRRRFAVGAFGGRRTSWIGSRRWGRFTRPAR